MIKRIAGVAACARLALLTIAADFALSNPARGDVLFQRQIPLDFRYDVSPPRPIVGPVAFDWAVFDFEGPPPPPEPEPGRVFDALRFSSGTVGQTFRVLPGDDPDFGTLESFLTNGREDNLSFAIDFLDTGTPANPLLGRNVSGAQEELWLFNRQSGHPYDLAGNDITAFSVRHDSFDVQTRGTVTTVTGAMTFTVEGTPLPEPGLMVLGIAGVGCLTRGRRR